MVPSECRSHSVKTRNFGALYAAIAILSFHWALVVYVHSTYLEQYVASASVGMLYVVSAALSVLTFLFISRVLHRAGNYHLTLVLSVAEFCALIGMATADSLRVAIPLFLVHQIAAPLLLFNIDVFMEEMIGDQEGSTGGRRGLLLGLMSFAGAVAPLTAGFLLGSNTPNFTAAYSAGALLMLPFIAVIMRHFRTFSDPEYSEIQILSTLHMFWVDRDIRYVFFAHFLLQLFFAWSVIYFPLYLATEIGFNWEQIGMILFVGLMAYVFFEYPIGIIADKWIGEKEMMALGFVVIGVATSWFSFIGAGAMGAWMFAMFLTRVGASFVETTTESYFFKHTEGSDANVISFFRITRPLSVVLGALLGSFCLLYLPFNLIFIILGFLMVPGIFFTLLLHDTK